jgi:pyruvate dehydrogenase E2 component (dihydrolipoamide acetyltransferase)
MDVLMPQLGETVREGKIVNWFKSVGDSVAAGENLCEVETDKVTIEVPALQGGTLNAINVEAGAVVPVGTIIAVVGEQGSAAATAPAAAPPRASPTAPTRAAPLPVAAAAPRRELDPFREVLTPLRNFGPARRTNGIQVTPLARRLAAEAGIDLGAVAGTGARGRITGGDVEKAKAARAPAHAPAAPQAFEEPISEIYLSRPHKVVALDGMRRTIAKRLVQSKTTIPHFYLAIDLDVDRLASVREELNAGAPKAGDGTASYRLSINDFIIKALALALQQVPQANAIWAGDSILQFGRSDVGVAVAIPGGLLTPVIASADTKPITAISNEMKGLAARARERALQPHEYQGGTTSVSNLGMHGIREFSAVINPPQSTILAVGASQRCPVERADGGVSFVGRIAAVLSCDHRVVDGALGAELLASFKHLIEHPLAMLV